LENHSYHPIAKAIQAYAKKPRPEITVTGVEEIPGSGLKGSVGGSEMLAGNTRLLEKHHIAFPAELSHSVDTLVAVSWGGKYIGHITIADKIKAGAMDAVRGLRRKGIHKVIMLSGDRTSV